MSDNVNSDSKSRSLKITVTVINGLWKLLAFSLILLAIIIASIRLFSGEISRFKPDLEVFLSEQLERKVSIQSISLEWPAQGPLIQLKQLELATDDTQPLNSLVIANGSVAINLWKSIYYRDWITDEINFQGIQAKLNPKLLEKNTTVEGTQKQANKINEWLLRQATIEIYDSFLLLSSETKKKFSYALPVLTFHGGDTRRQLKALAITSSGSKIEVRTEQNSKTDDAQRNFKFYLLGNNINLEEFPAELFYPELPQLKGSFNLELWAGWIQNNLSFLFSEVSAEEIIIGESPSSISLKPVKILWKPVSNYEATFVTSDIIIGMDNQSLPSFQLNGKRARAKINNDETWKVEGLDIPLQLLANISENYLPSELQQWVHNAKPEGELSDFSAELTLQENISEQPLPFKIEFVLNRFNAKQWQNYPGAINIDTHFFIDNLGGKFKITSTQGELDLAPLFRYPLQFSTLNSEIKFILEDDRTQLLWEGLLFDSNEVKINSTGKLEFLKDGGGYMEIAAYLYDGDTSFTPWFLPSGIMSDNLVGYLDDSINEGKLLTASAIIRGPFASFPFENEEGVFDIVAKVKDVNFQFLPNWPTINKLSAELRFFGNQMAITATKGEISGVQLKKATAKIANLGKTDSHLLLDITASGKLQNSMSLLKNSPLQNIANTLDVIKFGGNQTTHIKIDVPLKSSNTPKIAGTVSFNKSSITLKQPLIPFENVQGNIRFNQNGLHDGKLKGNLWQQGFNASLKDASTTEETIIQSSINSKIGTIGISELSGLNAGQFSKGAADIVGEMLFKTHKKNKTGSILLDFSSQLNGLEINLPGVFEKESEQLSAFSLNFELDGNNSIIQSTLDSHLTVLTSKGEGNWKGAVSIGNDLEENPIELPEDEVWKANLKLGDIDLSQWFEISKNLFTTKLVPQQSIPVHIEMSSTNLKAAGFEFGKTDFELDYHDTIEMNIQSEHINAQITKTSEPNQAVVINIKNLNLNPTEESTTTVTVVTDEQLTSAIEQSFAEFNPSSFPAIKLHCENCNYAKQALGNIELETLPAGENMGFKGHWYSPEAFDINFSGLWNIDGSQLSGKLTSNSFENFSNFWNISSGIKNSNIESNFSLSWPGSPFDFDTQYLQGKITSSLSEGYIDEVSTKGAQVFSFLSLQNLKRRLTLDFNDVFDDGFFYDKISGTFLIHEGRAYSDGVKIDGTAADVKISGYTDIVNKEFNQHIVVTPKLSSSLPVLAGWAISPTTALVALVLDKLFFKPVLDVVTQIDYKVSGSWDEPVLIEVGKQQKEFKLDEEEPEEIIPEIEQ